MYWANMQENDSAARAIYLLKRFQFLLTGRKTFEVLTFPIQIKN